MNIKEIQQLIKFVSKSGVSEVKIESKDLKISVKTGKNPTVIQNEPVLVSQQPIVQLAAKSLVFSIRHAWRHCLHVAANTCGWHRSPQPRHGFLRIGVDTLKSSMRCSPGTIDGS